MKKIQEMTRYNPKRPPVEWEKIPRQPLIDIVRLLECRKIRLTWVGRTQISEPRLKTMRASWIQRGGKNPEELLQQKFSGYVHTNDGASLILLCAYFEC